MNGLEEFKEGGGGFLIDEMGILLFDEFLFFLFGKEWFCLYDGICLIIGFCLIEFICLEFEFLMDEICLVFLFLELNFS